MATNGKPYATSGRGGYRPGGGRPKGSLNKMSQELREGARMSGELPHEFLLRVVRGELIRQKSLNDDGTVKESYLVPTMEMRLEAAKSAAPYFAPKISTVEVIAGVSDEQLDEFITRFAAEAGVVVGVNGEIEEVVEAAPVRVRKRLDRVASGIPYDPEPGS